MALTAQDRHPSRYVNVPSERVTTDFLHRYHLVIGLCIGGVIVTGIVAAALTTSLVTFFLAFAGMFLLVAIAEVLLIRKTWMEVLQVLSHDCDPQKLLEVITPLLDRFRFRAQTMTMLETWYATCSVLLGYPDVGLAWAERASRRNPKDTFWISILDVRASAFHTLGDGASLQSTRAQLEKLLENNSSRTAVARIARLSLDAAEESLAEMRGDWVSAYQRIGAIDALIDRPQQEVANTFRKARVAAAQGHVAEATPLYQFVATNGGTCACRDEAQRWLDANGCALVQDSQ